MMSGYRKTSESQCLTYTGMRAKLSLGSRGNWASLKGVSASHRRGPLFIGPILLAIMRMHS